MAGRMRSHRESGRSARLWNTRQTFSGVMCVWNASRWTASSRKYREHGLEQTEPVYGVLRRHFYRRRARCARGPDVVDLVLYVYEGALNKVRGRSQKSAYTRGRRTTTHAHKVTPSLTSYFSYDSIYVSRLFSQVYQMFRYIRDIEVSLTEPARSLRSLELGRLWLGGNLCLGPGGLGCSRSRRVVEAESRLSSLANVHVVLVGRICTVELESLAHLTEFRLGRAWCDGIGAERLASIRNILAVELRRARHGRGGKR